MPLQGLRTALRCLGHPLVWLSIALLVLNDHVFKAALPSWLTGKLSDFAGLFFFPFLLAAALSLPLDRLHCPVRRIGNAAFALTAGLFTMVKAVPWGNSLATELLLQAFGRLASIALDPTDLAALLALWPAWLLWRRHEYVERGRARPVPRGAWLALAAGALAAVATTPALPPPQLNYVVVLDGTWYMGTMTGEHKEHLASTNGGRTWEWMKAAPEGVTGPGALPAIACEPAPSQRCFRIDVPEQVEQSDDGGLTWYVAWQVPPERREWVRRRAVWNYDPGPYALAIDTRGGASTLVVAMGNEGALVRRPNGSWHRYAVSAAGPTAFYASTWSEVIRVLDPETNRILLCAVLVLWSMSGYAWARARAPWRALSRGVLIVLVGLPLCAACALQGNFMTLDLWLLYMPLFGGFTAPLAIWLAVRPHVDDHRRALRLGAGAYAAALLVFPLGWLPLLLWATGPVSSYADAVAASGVTALAGVACATAWVFLDAGLRR